MQERDSLRYIRFLDDFPAAQISNSWIDLRWGFDAGEKRYVVETNPGIVSRCLLMATDPGDIVLDPTCGSGTTAYTAEKWGRRWITCDTSRVAIASRQAATDDRGFRLLRSSLILTKGWAADSSIRPFRISRSSRSRIIRTLGTGCLTPRSAQRSQSMRIRRPFTISRKFGRTKRG